MVGTAKHKFIIIFLLFVGILLPKIAISGVAGYCIVRKVKR